MTDDEILRLWADAMTDANCEMRAAVVLFGNAVQARTRARLEANPPPPSIVANAVATIAGLATALRNEQHDPTWIGHQIYKALAPIRTVLRDADLRQTIQDAADERESPSTRVHAVPVVVKPAEESTVARATREAAMTIAAKRGAS